MKSAASATTASATTAIATKKDNADQTAWVK
jgi:hypothetical protein